VDSTLLNGLRNPLAAMVAADKCPAGVFPIDTPGDVARRGYRQRCEITKQHLAHP
jgi:hypothetical protein